MWLNCILCFTQGRKLILTESKKLPKNQASSPLNLFNTNLNPTAVVFIHFNVLFPLLTFVQFSIIFCVKILVLPLNFSQYFCFIFYYFGTFQLSDLRKRGGYFSTFPSSPTTTAHPPPTTPLTPTIQPRDFMYINFRKIRRKFLDFKVFFLLSPKNFQWL